MMGVVLDRRAPRGGVARLGWFEAWRRHRMQRVCIEAFQQGGLLTVEDLANRLFNGGQRTLCRDLEVLRRQR